MKTLARFPIGLILGFWLGGIIVKHLDPSYVGVGTLWGGEAFGAVVYWFMREVLGNDPGAPWDAKGRS